MARGRENQPSILVPCSKTSREPPNMGTRKRKAPPLFFSTRSHCNGTISSMMIFIFPPDGLLQNIFPSYYLCSSYLEVEGRIYVRVQRHYSNWNECHLQLNLHGSKNNFFKPGDVTFVLITHLFLCQAKQTALEKNGSFLLLLKHIFFIFLFILF